MKSIASSHGFTIVEIMVAIIVGAIFFGGGVTIFLSQETLSQKNENLVIANSFAEAKFEQLRNEGYLTLSPGLTDITNELPDTLPPPRSATYTIDDTTTGIKKVTLSIGFNNAGSDYNTQYETIIGELGVGQN